MNKYTAYERSRSTWQQKQLQKLISAEEALLTLKKATVRSLVEGNPMRNNKYWLTSVTAAKAVLIGKSSTHFTHISPIRVENREVKYMFSYSSIY